MIILAGVLWGIIGIFVRELNAAGLSSMEIVLVRASVASGLMLVGTLALDRHAMKARLKDLWCFLGTGIGSIVLFNFCYFQAVTLTSMSVAAVLLYTAPAFVMILSAILFGEKITGRKIGALLLSILGLMLVTGLVGCRSGISIAGLFYGLGAGLGYALYSIFSRFAIGKGYQPLTITFYTFLTAAVGSALLIGQGGSAHVVEVFEKKPQILLPALLLGSLCTVLPYALYTRGLRFTENGPAAIMASVEPVSSTVAGALLYGEIPSLRNLAGIGMVLAGIALCSLSGKQSSSDMPRKAVNERTG